MKPVWIIDDDKSIRWVFEKALARTDLEFKTFSSVAEALNAYEGAMILVSHVPDFVEKIRIDEILDLGKK